MAEQAAIPNYWLLLQFTILQRFYTFLTEEHHKTISTQSEITEKKMKTEIYLLLI